MIFRRSLPPRHYRDYARYRPLLRRDFQYRCAYCLTHERYLGGEAESYAAFSCPPINERAVRLASPMQWGCLPFWLCLLKPYQHSLRHQPTNPVDGISPPAALPAH